MKLFKGLPGAPIGLQRDVDNSVTAAMPASRDHLHAHCGILSATPAHEGQPIRPHGRWQRLVVQLGAHLSPVAACSRFGQREHQQASISEAALQLSAGGCWIFFSSTDPPSRPSVGLGSMQHVALSRFSSRCVASCRSCQRHAAIFGAGRGAAAGLVAAVVARGMQPADPWPVGLQVTRNVVRFGAVGDECQCGPAVAASVLGRPVWGTFACVKP